MMPMKKPMPMPSKGQMAMGESMAEDIDSEAKANVLDEIQALMDSLEGRGLEAALKLRKKRKGPGEADDEGAEEGAEGEPSDEEKLKAIAK